MIIYSLLQLVDGGFLLLSTYSLHAENSMYTTHWKNANFKIKFYLSNIFNKVYVCARSSGAHASGGKASQPKLNSYIYMCACVCAPSPKGGKASRPKLNSNFRAPKQVAHNQVSNSSFFKVVLQKTYLPV